jgi:hypothetical protein
MNRKQHLLQLASNTLRRVNIFYCNKSSRKIINLNSGTPLLMETKHKVNNKI